MGGVGFGRDGRGLHEQRRSDKVDYPGEGEEGPFNAGSHQRG